MQDTGTGTSAACAHLCQPAANVQLGFREVEGPQVRLRPPVQGLQVAALDVQHLRWCSTAGSTVVGASSNKAPETLQWQQGTLPTSVGC